MGFVTEQRVVRQDCHGLWLVDVGNAGRRGGQGVWRIIWAVGQRARPCRDRRKIIDPILELPLMPSCRRIAILLLNLCGKPCRTGVAAERWRRGGSSLCPSMVS